MTKVGSLGSAARGEDDDTEIIAFRFSVILMKQWVVCSAVCS